MTLLFIGSTELIIIGGVALLIFGGKKIPELMKGLGKGVKSFKQGMNEPLVDDEKEKEKDDRTEEEKGTEKEKSEEKE
jgi:sec-independent protein translocase protein TatA